MLLFFLRPGAEISPYWVICARSNIRLLAFGVTIFFFLFPLFEKNDLFRKSLPTRGLHRFPVFVS